MKSREYYELNGIDGEPVEFEWNIFSGHTILELHEIERKMAKDRFRPEEFKDRIIFMPMYNDINWTKDGNLQLCTSNSLEVKLAQTDFRKDIGHSSDPEQKTLYGTHTCKPEGLWNGSADMIMLHLRDSGHPIFQATSALDRESFRFTTTVIRRPQSCYFP